MVHRLSKITTRTGDDGTTGLGDGTRTDKDSARIEAMGAVDELNSTLGVLLAEDLPEDVRVLLLDVQHSLFDVGGELSIPGHTMVSTADVTALESHLEHYNERLAPLKEFILPGGTRAAALCHLARASCRTAERRVVSLSKTGEAAVSTRQYLNRLSDLLFVIARHLNHHAQAGDVIWQRER